MLGGEVHRVLQRDALGSLHGEVAQALVGRADPIVGLRRGPEPALAQLTSLAEVVGVFGQSQSSSRRQEVPADPGRLQTQDAVAIGEGLLEEIMSRIDYHPSPIYPAPAVSSVVATGETTDACSTASVYGRTAFFRLNSWALGLILFAVVLGATALGVVLGRSLRHLKDDLREPFGVLQGVPARCRRAHPGLRARVGRGRYEARRAAVVDEANAIGTTYLRAQTLAEPVRSRSLALLTDYTDTRISLSHSVPGSPQARQVIAQGEAFLRELWTLGGQALDAAPIHSAPRLYIESLNETIDMDNVRVSSLSNGVPGEVSRWRCSAPLRTGLARGLPVDPRRGRPGTPTRRPPHHHAAPGHLRPGPPTRGLIRIPDTPLVALRASMKLPPAAAAPTNP